MVHLAIALPQALRVNRREKVRFEEQRSSADKGGSPTTYCLALTAGGTQSRLPSSTKATNTTPAAATAAILRIERKSGRKLCSILQHAHGAERVSCAQPGHSRGWSNAAGVDGFARISNI